MREPEKSGVRLDEESIFGLCNSLNAWLHPVRDSFPGAANVMLLAEKTLFALVDEARKKKILILADLDTITDTYKVMDEVGYSIGEKSLHFGYLKPEYGKNGRMTGGKHCGIAERFYKSAPPWLKYEVFKIDSRGGFLTFHVKKPKP